MAAYKQGREDGKATVHDCGQHSAACCSAGYNRGYRDGYNARATSAEHSYQMFGIREWNQHGQGENP